MVGDRLGVGRADADIDQGDAATARSDQVVGRHLEAAPGRALDHGMGVRRIGIDAHIACRREGLVMIVFLQLADRPGGEGIDIAVIVCEQDKLLRVFIGRAGVVAQPLQRIIDPRRLEQESGLTAACCITLSPLGRSSLTLDRSA